MHVASRPREQLLHVYRTMVAIRRFEETVRDLFRCGHVPGIVHVSIGEEAVAAGVCAALRGTDTIATTHRGHGHVLAKGGEPGPMLAEVLGRRTGYCKGKGGSMHLVCHARGVLGANGIVGAGLPIATGAALAAQLRGTGDVAVAFFGDGAANQGTFHESLNLAALWTLPVIFVCQNNAYGEFTPTAAATAGANIAGRAAGYAMPGTVVDGNDVLAVLDAADAAVARARRGDGPSLIEAKTYRWEGHVIGEEATLPIYRPAAEVEAATRDCPIARLRQALIAGGIAAPGELDTIEATVAGAMRDAVAFAEAGPLPDPRDALDDVFADS